MPIGFHPDDTCRIHLDCFDKDKPEDQRAWFVCKFLTANQAREVEKLRDQAAQAASDAVADETINRAILKGIVGWERVKDHEGKEIPFGPEGLGEMSLRMKQRIAYEYPWRTGLSEVDQKN